MRDLFFENDVDESKYGNILYGLGRGAHSSAGHNSQFETSSAA